MAARRRPWGVLVTRMRITSTVILAVIIGVVIAPAAWAADGDEIAVDGIVYQAWGGVASVTGYDGTQGTDIVIAESVQIDGTLYQVRTITANALDGSALTSVSIPGSISTIREGAFDNNPDLAIVRFMGDVPSSLAMLVFGNAHCQVFYYGRYAGFATSRLNDYRLTALATVTLNANGHGSVGQALDVEVGRAIASPTAPTEAGYVFDGWSTAASGGSAFDFTSPITADITLYAQWSVLTAAIAAPATALPGASLIVTGDSFTPGESVEIWLLSSPVHLTDTTAALDGTINVTVTIPAGTPAGLHHLEARAASGTASRAITMGATLAATGGGSDNAPLAAIALLLTLAGAGLTLAQRRRLARRA